MSKVFEGFTVVELADRRNQLVGKIMADAGARVIQIEPIAGSAGRAVGPFVDDVEDPDRSLDYWWFNTGKESLRIDVIAEAGRQLVRRLVSKADIFVESTRPGTLAAHGLDYDSLAAENPGLIYASLTDFGQDGPWLDLQMNDFAHLALGGQMASTGYSDPKETPIGGQGHQAYNMASVMMTHTITVALYERLTSGRGQFLDLSIHEACAVGTMRAVTSYLWYNEPFVRQTGQHAAGKYRPQQQVRCADGQYIQAIAARFNNNTWVKLIAWMNEVGVAGELADPLWLDEFYRAEQTRNGSAIREGIIRLLEAVPAHEAFMRAQSIGIAWGKVRSPEENREFAHYDQRGFWVEVDHPEIGKHVTYPRGFYYSNELEMRPQRRAPALGEHTAKILYSDLGCDEESIGALKRAGVVR